jgi:hypothetical protein
MDPGPLFQLGRVLIGFGILLVVAGAIVLLASRMGLPLGRLPGDFAIRGKHFAFYAPVATCLLLSVVLSLVLWLVNHLRR